MSPTTGRPLALRALVTTLVAATALTLGTAPAHAATYNHDDAVGDVESIRSTDDSWDVDEASRNRGADITQLRVRHGESRLIMRVETVDLTRRNTQVIGPTFTILTPRQRYSADLAAIVRRGEDGRVATLTTGNHRDVPCRGLFADLDFAGDVAMVSVPRRCVGSPRRVQLKVVMWSFKEGRESIRLRMDSAMDDGPSRRVKATPPIRSAAVTAR